MLSVVLLEPPPEVLGRAHCSEGGGDFFLLEQRAPIIETGLIFADDFASLAPGGRSLYVGASVASPRCRRAPRGGLQRR